MCPQEQSEDGVPMQAKLFSQCYIGPDQRAMCACEALVLAYAPSDVRFLEDQVSVWLENDLPTYYWFHRVPADLIESHYMSFLHGCRKIIYDSSIEGVCFSNVHWHRSNMVADLTRSRLLPIRRTLGQFLSRFSPEELVQGLQQVSVRVSPWRRGEGESLLAWQINALQQCGARLEGEGALNSACVEAVPTDGSPTIAIDWLYKDSAHYLNWQFFEAQTRAVLKTNLGNGPVEQTIHLQPMSAEESLAESIFFSS
ncbi:MAG: hypothetical protein B7X06_02545 [Verrucomicrobia bacterium 21-51-4]|nr:MAG: hypothetical protein B7X06_02545 [Verrucomicrobia bacterium 21-51-4]